MRFLRLGGNAWRVIQLHKIWDPPMLDFWPMVFFPHVWPYLIFFYCRLAVSGLIFSEGFKAGGILWIVCTFRLCAKCWSWFLRMPTSQPPKWKTLQRCSKEMEKNMDFTKISQWNQPHQTHPPHKLFLLIQLHGEPAPKCRHRRRQCHCLRFRPNDLTPKTLPGKTHHQTTTKNAWQFCVNVTRTYRVKSINLPSRG